ncbi:hypothetical protein A0J46_05830 [Photobacterium damselae subsp. damselae]|nr:hypothetical protein A0J46_05830 [Photobacterium damselae subsp. damselae]
MSLSNWQIISGLQPTEEWKPGSIISVTGIVNEKIKLKNSNGDIIKIPFDISGIQYGLGDSGNKFEVISSGGSPFPSCDKSIMSSSKASVIGKKCAAKDSYQSKNKLAFTPFHFARPLILMKDSDIVEKFNDPSLTKGVYKGTVNIIPLYLFKSSTGTWTYRTTTPIPIDISISYSGSQMISFDVIGDGIITPYYEREQKLVNGFTEFQVRFNGVFSKGSKINMKLLEPDSGSFTLNATDASIPEGKDKIPYGIYCRGESCHDNYLVDQKGKMIISGGKSYLESKDSSREISFILGVGYKDIPMNKVATAQYRDSFTIIFENEM